MDKLTPIPEYEGLYSVTRDGRIFSHRRNTWMKQQKDRKGYLQVVLTKDKKIRCFWAHRIVANTFIAPVEGKLYINHKNSVRSDNRVGNLEWCTMRENIIHGWKQGRTPVRGEKHPNTKITEKEVKAMRQEYKQGSVRQIDLAKKYGMSRPAVTNILNGVTWGHIL